MILLIDNYDSFSYNLYQYVGEINPDIKVIRNDEMTVEEIEKLNPERIIIGGGIAAQEEYLFPLLDRALREKLFPLVYEKLTLRFAALQNNAGMLGALYNFLMRQ